MAPSPRRHRHEPAKPGGASARTEPDRPREVLVVDDDEGTRKVLRISLEAAGYRVLTAGSATEAWQLMLGSGPRPALLLLDLIMPGLTPEDLLGEMRRTPDLGSIPVVVISGTRDVETRATALHCAGWLRKPMELSELRELVGRCVPPT